MEEIRTFVSELKLIYFTVVIGKVLFVCGWVYERSGGEAAAVF